MKSWWIKKAAAMIAVTIVTVLIFGGVVMIGGDGEVL